MKFTTIVALVGLASALRVSQKATVAVQTMRGPPPKEEGERREPSSDEEGSYSDEEGEEWKQPTAAQIFEACDANADALLSLDEAVDCAARKVRNHIQEEFNAHWPTDEAGEPI